MLTLISLLDHFVIYSIIIYLIVDLLSKDPKNSLELKENIETGTYVKDLTSFVVKNASGNVDIIYNSTISTKCY